MKKKKMYELCFQLFYHNKKDKLDNSHYFGMHSFNTDRPINYIQIQDPVNMRILTIDLRKGKLWEPKKRKSRR